MSNPDGLFMVPALSTSAREGSFMGGSEDQFMSCMWRVRSWIGSCDVDIKCNFTPPDPGFIVLPAGVSFVAYSGAQWLLPTDAYGDESDILCDYRETRAISYTSSQGVPQQTEIQYGTACEYSERRTTDGVLIPGSGVMDSILTFTAYDGDEFAGLSTFPGPGSLATGITLNVMIRGELAKRIYLYADDISGTFPDFNWTGGDIILQPESWWEWPLDGEPTWDRYTGEKLRPSERVGQGGRTLDFIAQP